MDREQGSTWPQQLKSFVGWFVFIAGALAVSVEVFLHKSRSFGERYIGLQGTAVILLVPLYTLFWQGYDVTPLVGFLGAYLVMCFFVRIGALVRRRRGGPQPHTHYTGAPRIMRFTGSLSERTVKMIVEPLLVFLVAVVTMPVSEPLGGYLLVAAVGLLASTHLSVGYDRTRALDMNDVYLDQRDVAERFRAMRHDRSWIERN